MALSQRRLFCARGTRAQLRLIALLFAMVFAALLVGACKDKKPPPPPLANQPVPAPPGLLADIFVTTPETTWQRMRGKIGGPAALLPSGFSTLVVTLLGLPPQAAEQIDSNQVVFGALVETAPGGAADLVVAVHLRDEARVIELLSGGQEPRYVLKKDSSGVALLEPKVKAPDVFAAMGIANHYLVASKSSAALLMAGPYVARTLPTLPKPAAEITAIAGHAALAGPLVARLRTEWANFKKAREQEDLALRQQHDGRAPDFGDPAAALADIDGKVRRFTEIMTDLSQARMETNTDERGAHTRLLMVPQTGGGVASKEIGALAIGDAAPILELPGGSVVAILTRESEDVRKAGAQDQLDGIVHVLGDRIASEDRKKVGDVLEAWAKGRGDWVLAGVDWTPDSKALIVRGPVRDAATLESALLGVFELSRVSGLKDPIERFVGKLTFSKPTVEGTSKNVHVRREPPEPPAAKANKPDERPDPNKPTARRRKGAENNEFDVTWEIDAARQSFQILAAGDAKAWLAKEAKTKSPPLAEDPEIATVVQALGNETSFVFLLQPFRIMAGMSPRANPSKVPSSPVVFSYGRSKSDGWFRLDLPYFALTEILRGLIAR